MSAAKPTKGIHIAEKTVQSALAHYYRTKKEASVLREVQTPVGFIDLIVHEPNSTRLIEVKEFKGIKHAVGQVLNYIKFRPADCLEIVYFHRDLQSTRQPHAALYGHCVEMPGKAPQTIQLTNILSLIPADELLAIERARAVDIRDVTTDAAQGSWDELPMSMYYSSNSDLDIFEHLGKVDIDW
jgi:hypothetical protein